MTLTLRIEENPAVQSALKLVQDTFNEKSATKAIYSALAYASERRAHEVAKNKIENELYILEKKFQNLQSSVGNFVSSFERLQDIRLQN